MTKEKKVKTGFHVTGILVKHNDEVIPVDRYLYAYSEAQAVSMCTIVNGKKVGELRDYTTTPFEWKRRENKNMSLLSGNVSAVSVPTKYFLATFNGRQIKVTASVYYLDPNNKRFIKGTVKVLDDGRGNEGKEAFFLWDTSKYSHPSIWIKKRLTFDARKVDFVMFLLNEYKKARQFGMIMSDQPVEPNKSVEASIFTPINENIDGLEV